MGTLTKLIAPVVAAVVGLGLGLFLVMGKQQQVQRLEQQVMLTNQHVAQLEIQKQEFVKKISGFADERKTFEDRVATLRSELSKITQTLQSSRFDLQGLEEQYELLGRERTTLQRRAAELVDEREAAQLEAVQFAEDNVRLEQAVQRSRQRFALLDRDYQQLQQQAAEQQASSETLAYTGLSQTVGSVTLTPFVTQPSATLSGVRGASASSRAVELPPIIVRRESAGAFQQVRGHLIEVNMPHGFVVVDRGSEDGVHVGMSFDLLRGTEPVGRAVVVRVRPQLSACDIAGTTTSGPLHIGDVAVQSGL